MKAAINDNALLLLHSIIEFSVNKERYAATLTKTVYCGGGRKMFEGIGL